MTYRPLVCVLSCLASLSVFACTPVPAIAFLLVGTAGYGAAVGALIGLPIAIAIKAAFYARFAGYGYRRGAYDMVMGNIGSTVPGFLIAAGVASTALTFQAIAITGLVLCVVAGRLLSRAAQFSHPWLQGVRVAFFTCLALVGSFVLLMIAGEFNPAEVEEGWAGLYWAVKIGGVFFGLLATLAISVVFEGAIIFSIRRKMETFPKRAALEAIVKANLWTFLIISILGAALTLPQRFGSSGFLFIPL